MMFEAGRVRLCGLRRLIFRQFNAKSLETRSKVPVCLKIRMQEYAVGGRTDSRNGSKLEDTFQQRLHSDKWWVRWAAKAQTKEFNKGLTKYLILAYAGFIVYGGYHFKNRYAQEKELNQLVKRLLVAPDHEPAGPPLNEYEALRLKELQGKLRTRDRLKLEKYREMIQKKEEEYYSNVKNIGAEYEFNAREFDGVVLDDASYYKQNKDNDCILPSRDTSEFYDSKAPDYDSEINFEEKMIFLGKRRKWLMSKAFGDVLEVACGTGRNVKYLDLAKINSITYLDPSRKMVEITNNKFRERFAKYKKAAFVVGKAEDLIKLASGNGAKNVSSKTESDEIDTVHKESKVKYDTIIESFGLCSHEDPVKALQNFAKLLKPGGRIILLEHGRGTWNVINDYLDKRAEKRLETWGCRWNLDIGEILDDSGLEIVQEDTHQFGTLWCVVAKKAGDVKRYEELSLYEKYFTSL